LHLQSSKQNCYIISLRAIIKAIFTSLACDSFARHPFVFSCICHICRISHSLGWETWILNISSGSFACSYPLRLQQLIHTPHYWFYSSRRIQCEAMHPPPSSSPLLESYLNQATGLERLQPFAEHAITAHHSYAFLL